MRQIFLILLLLTFLLSSCKIPQNQTIGLNGRIIHIRTDPTYPPFETINPTTKQIEGFDIDLAKAVCKLINCVAEFKAETWANLKADIGSGHLTNYDMIMSGVSITAEREKTIDFSNPYITFSLAIAVRKANAPLTLADFKDNKQALTLGALLSTTWADTAKEIVGKERVKTFDSFDDTVAALLKSEVDGIMVDGLTVNDLIKKQQGKLVANIRNLNPDPIGMVFETNDTLVESFNKGLDQLKASNTYNQLIEKWFMAD